MRTRHARRASLTLVAALVWLLGGCRSLPPAPVPTAAEQAAAWTRHRSALLDIDTFLLSGRVASAELGLRADLRWLELADERFEIRLAGPFGASAVELRGDPDQVEVRSSEGVERSRNPENWIRQHYGWTIPLRGLRYWALGVPDPHLPAVPELDAAGRLASLVQGGWTLTYSEYQRQGEYDLPRRFEAANGQVKLKLLIDRWDLQPATTQTP